MIDEVHKQSLEEITQRDKDRENILEGVYILENTPINKILPNFYQYLTKRFGIIYSNIKPLVAGFKNSNSAYYTLHTNNPKTKRLEEIGVVSGFFEKSEKNEIPLPITLTYSGQLELGIEGKLILENGIRKDSYKEIKFP